MRRYQFKIAMLVLFCCLAAVSGCSGVQANPGTRDVLLREEQLVSDSMFQQRKQRLECTEKPTSQSNLNPMPVDSSKEGSSLLVEDWSGSYLYKIESWDTYDNWEEAGISEELLCSTKIIPEIEEGGGVLLVTLTVENLDAKGLEGELHSAYVIRPITKEQIELAHVGVDAYNDPHFYFVDEGEAEYFSNANLGVDANPNDYALYVPPEIGEKVTYTIGFILSSSAFSAVESEELFLYYAIERPKTVEDFLLLYLEAH